jgi:hypothetical protein
MTVLSAVGFASGGGRFGKVRRQVKHSDAFGTQEFVELPKCGRRRRRQLCGGSMVAAAVVQQLKLGRDTVTAAAWWRWAKLLPALAAAQQHGSGSVVVA